MDRRWQKSTVRKLALLASARLPGAGRFGATVSVAPAEGKDYAPPPEGTGSPLGYPRVGLHGRPLRRGLHRRPTTRRSVVRAQLWGTRPTTAWPRLGRPRGLCDRRSTSNGRHRPSIRTSYCPLRSIIDSCGSPTERSWSRATVEGPADSERRLPRMSRTRRPRPGLSRRALRQNATDPCHGRGIMKRIAAICRNALHRGARPRRRRLGRERRSRRRGGFPRRRPLRRLQFLPARYFGDGD